ncbi:hypothetical protein KR032_002289 [Drosophila birchii]|nr:hypothetical protein KR032_002289 [Drosophila birchii]
MNPEKLKKLEEQVRIGGKGTPRRKKKIVHSTPSTDDKKLQASLKKLSVNTIPGIEEVNIIKNDGTVIHFNNPKTQASLPANTFAFTGHGQNKTITEMMPDILTQLGPQDINQLKKLATEIVNKSAAGSAGCSAAVDATDDDVPDLVKNFEEVAIADAAPVDGEEASSA